MDNMIKLFIADSNVERSSILSKYLADTNITIVGQCSDGNKACSMICQLKPDVIIINLLLTEIDGLSLIENINNLLLYIPKIICVSPVANEFIIKHAFALGISYFMLLPVEMPVLVQRITDIYAGNTSDENNNCYCFDNTPFRYTEETVKTLLLEIGIPANLKGYSYLSYAIGLLVEQNKISGSITKELYPAVALKFNSTVSRVERGIRHAIEIAWCRGKIKHINEIFGINLYNDYEKPTSCEFISLVADRVMIMKKTNRA